MAPTGSDKISATQLLLPVAILSVTLALLFAFQIAQIMRDRDVLNQTLGRLEAPFVESQKVKQQFGGLVAGTNKLALEGNETAKKFVEKLKQIGIIIDPPADQPAPVPAAQKPLKRGPVKP